MTKEDVKTGIRCCPECVCVECPYEKYNDKEKGYVWRYVHKLMADINKLYFEWRMEK